MLRKRNLSPKGKDIAVDAEILAKEIKGIRFWHTIDLGNGIKTPGQITSEITLSRLGLPEDLSGKSVIDIGAWDGFYSFECERRGASDVFAIDGPSWTDPKVKSGKAGFDLCKTVLGSNVRSELMSVYDLDPARHGRFDIALLLGVFYHLRHPLLGLEKIASVCKDTLIVETYLGPGVRHLRELPLMEFYELKHNSDPENWWGPTPECVMAMMRVAGFSDVTAHDKSSENRWVFHGRR